MATLQLHLASFLPIRYFSDELVSWPETGIVSCYSNNWKRRDNWRKFLVRAADSDGDRRMANDAVVTAVSENVDSDKSHQNVVRELLQESAGSSAPVFVFSIKKVTVVNVSFGLFILATVIVVAVRSFAVRNSRSRVSGSVADLIRRGQIRSDRRGISTPLKYDDPFNNPMVKVSKTNSTVEMCGKVYRLAPVTLTDEQRKMHKNRRSRAYQWKRPTVFLKEGESIPPDIDPDTVRWIPANHPFATTSSDIDEDFAQSNVRQKHGVPFRIQAEHEALQRKLEALQNEQKLGKLAIDPAAAHDFERPNKQQAKPEDHEESTGKKKSTSNEVRSPSDSK